MLKGVTALSMFGAIVLAAIGPAIPANAAAFSPGGGAVTFSGTLSINGTTAADCVVTLKANIASDGSVAEIWSAELAPGSWQCGLIVTPTSLPWYAYPTTTTQVIFSTFSLSGFTSCSGPVVASWSNSTPGQMSFASAVIPGTPNNCTITGVLYASPSLTIL